MNILIYIGLLVVAGLFTRFISAILGDLVATKIRPCNIDFINRYYFEIIFDFIIGGVLYSVIMITGLKDVSILVGIILGFGCNSIPLIFGKMRDYETLRKNLPLLDIHDNESFEEFVRNNIENSED